MLKVRKLNRFAILPKKVPGSAGYDLYSCEPVTIRPEDRAIIRIGIVTEFPSNYVGRICDRSGMAVKEGLYVVAGVIDANYRGEWCVVFYNSTNQYKKLKAQTRIAQVLFYKVADFSVIEVNELTETGRGKNGFGSTGEN